MLCVRSWYIHECFTCTSYSDRYHWSKVEELHEKKDNFMKLSSSTNSKKEVAEESSSDSDADEADFEEFLDWRTKHS